MSKHGILAITVVFAAVALAGCGGGGELPVEDSELVGEWTLVDFQVWDYSTGEYWDTESFGDFDGFLVLRADGTAYASVCIEGTCLGGSMQWGAANGRFWDGEETGAYTLEDGVLTIDWSGDVDGHSVREVKRYVRADDFDNDFAYGKRRSTAPRPPQGDVRSVMNIATGPARGF